MAHGEYVHVESAGASGDTLADPAIPKDPEGLAGEFGPYRRRCGADGPLALPIPLAERRIEANEVAGQRQHRPDHVFGDSVLVAVDIRQPRSAGQRCAVDPVETRAGHLNQFEAPTSTPHLAREHHCHQHVDVGEARDDPGLVRHDYFARDGQISTYRAFEARGERPDNPDLQHGWFHSGLSWAISMSCHFFSSFPRKRESRRGRGAAVALDPGFRGGDDILVVKTGFILGGGSWPSENGMLKANRVAAQFPRRELELERRLDILSRDESD